MKIYSNVEELKHELLCLGTKIKINDCVYKELLNVIYSVQFDQNLLNSFIKPVSLADEVERNYLIENAIIASEKIRFDENTRQVAFTNCYENTNYGRCITTVNFFARNGLLFLNEYYRSQHLENLKYDNQTAMLLVKNVIDNLSELNLCIGSITIFCANFHTSL